MVHELVAEGDETTVCLVTQSDPETRLEQEAHLNQIAASFSGTRVLARGAEVMYVKNEANRVRT